MSNTTLCRLCVSSSTEFKTLFDDSGQLNGIYKIAVKYFDPILINHRHKQLPNVICVECWQHIEDFHRFQLSVIDSQAQLEYQQPIVCLMKLEDCSIATKQSDYINTISAMDVQTLSTTSLTLSDRTQIDDISSTRQYDTNTISSKQSVVNSPTLPQITTNAKQEDSILNESFFGTQSAATSVPWPIDAINTKNQFNPNTKLPIPTNSTGVSDNPPYIADNKMTKIEYDDFIAKWIGELKCYVCQGHFVTFTMLHAHFFLKHRGIKSYTLCCGVKITYRSYFAKHIQQFHMSKPLKKCRFCKATFLDVDQLRNHILMECKKDTITYNCDICLGIFSQENTLRKHYRLKHQKYPLPTYTCPHCNIIFKTHNALDNHKKILHPKEAANNNSTDVTTDEMEYDQDEIEFAKLNNKVYTNQTIKREDNLQNSVTILTTEEVECQKIEAILPKQMYFTGNAEKSHYSRKSNAVEVETKQENFEDSLTLTNSTYTQINIIKEEISIYPSDIDSEDIDTETEQSEFQSTENNNTNDITPDWLDFVSKKNGHE